MKINSLVIENFKSIERIELIEPNPFTVFVGPNGSGKSNIFEALELGHYIESFVNPADLFGGKEIIRNRRRFANELSYISLEINDKDESFGLYLYTGGAMVNCGYHTIPELWSIKQSAIYKRFSGLFFKRFLRLFVNNPKGAKINFDTSDRLRDDAKNLDRVLKRILENEIFKTEIVEWLELFVPEFKNIEVIANPLDGKDTFLWYEQHSEKPFGKNLISDGTYNIIALLTAVYQSDEPQFLCIEEPENGLNPQVAKELVHFFRLMCEDKGHYIWLNTHSQSIVSQLRPEELIVVEKREGATQIKQFSKDDFKNWRMDEAWLTNALGGGLPW